MSLPQYISVTEELVVVKDRSNSILLLSFPDCLRPDLPPVLHTNSPLLPGLVLRHLQTYASGGEILDITAEMTGMAGLFHLVLLFIVLLRSGVRSEHAREDTDPGQSHHSGEITNHSIGILLSFSIIGKKLSAW